MLFRFIICCLLLCLLQGCGQGTYDSRMDTTIQRVNSGAPIGGGSAPAVKPEDEEGTKDVPPEEEFADPDDPLPETDPEDE